MLSIIATPFGAIRTVWTPHGLFSCSFVDGTTVDEGACRNDSGCGGDVASDAFDLGSRMDPPGEQPSLLDERQMILQQELRDAFDEYFDRGTFVWDLKRLDWSGISEFHGRVLRECFRIPSGSVIAYSGLAERSGRPRAARAVGSAMARNRWPILIPCHRVIATNGSLGGYSGTGGIKTKRALLEMERQHAAVTV